MILALLGLMMIALVLHLNASNARPPIKNEIPDDPKRREPRRKV